ncbi:ABC transporter permease [Neobacillus niacini]|uniref:ABC transporter permease n=1 Tax=Neobacillus niacini TaxID=86668 RepID=UPI0030036E44
MVIIQVTETSAELIAVKEKLKREQKKILTRRFFSNKSLMIGCLVIAIISFLATFGPLLASYEPLKTDIPNRFQAPNSENLLGTDEFGRDVLTRILYGARVTMGVGFVVAILTSILGMIIGLYASYYKTLDHILMRISDGLMAIPGILLAIALVAALGSSVFNVIISLTVVFTPSIARVIRSSAVVIREQTYIEAMKAQGASSFRIMWLHIMPNTISPLIVQASFIFADTIITEAGLSFLGAGVPAPDPSWGNMLFDGKLAIFNAWWMTVFPGMMVVMSVLGLNLMGDGLRDYIDPHLKTKK